MRCALALVLAGCAVPAAVPEAPPGRWVLAEERGRTSLVWVLDESDGGFVAIEAESWIAFRRGVGGVGVAEVRIAESEPGATYEFHAVPARADVTLVTPAVVVAERSARFEFRPAAPGRAGIRVWAVRRLPPSSPSPTPRSTR